ncbi:CorA family divalent cation transporter [Lactobacillus sp. UMNPBX4]|uniref:CorA family divalent cation transporter n=1 Tax=Lactobacillus sp. UMNPBX4 TaxID=2042043 RepID=UPI001E5237D2|nr:CorA family divalent cation transporter [Lactobacillus sp. UMNPBX4]
MPEKSFLILKSNLTASDIKQLTSQWDLDSAIFANLFSQLDHINQKLNAVKRKIDYLDSVARETTKTKELKKVTDLTRELVYLKHTLDDQTESLRSFGEYLKKNQLASSADIASLMTKQAQLTKMIHVYTDLLNSISGLFTAMMDSHLNHLMKYLNSVALIIAIPTLISGIWGMNI